ncbi:TonB-dependent receptor [Aliarcobacter trophiarum LMG 25534]|uniref:TonB-dependent receptor n=1 Tax=Aliarcobacter trophiarum LMG 25534 TaxID=1032241 RepID=A0AAD0QKB5_9BACT|nr:TonB-dependent receptor [Aliarcobacter trophiarum]AXK49513.1 TonB-dependent receptor [Aliarcobacter trophiarum LMG 25534]RXI27977.1 TonB-dependent receptor [Aliarcobacter trophiarum]RXJ91245.1 TonB-dependent receptor [Aliarcobacter trophiarum LMG 25534]
MKKRIIVSSFVSFIVLESLNATEVRLDEVKITTATKTEKSIDGVSASTVIITKEDIEKVGATTIGEVLEKVPSINVQLGRFPHPSSASKGSVSIRGVSPNGTLILLDGKRLSGETEQPYEMNRIPTSMIERIEIVKGSMSTLYGSDAIGGVINIITKRDLKDRNYTTIDLKYGSNAYSKARQKNANFTTMGNIDGYKYKVYASTLDTSSFKKDKNYSQKVINPQNGTPIPQHSQNGKSGVLGVSYGDSSTLNSVGVALEKNVTDSLTLGADVNYFNEDREGDYIGSSQQIGQNGMVLNTPINSKDKNHRYDSSIFVKYDISDDLSTTLRYYTSIYKKRNETKAINFDSAVSKKFSANVRIDDVESITTYSLNNSNLLTFGLDYRKERRDSAAINKNPQSSEFVRKEIEYKAIYLQDEIEFTDSLNATVGVRYDDISNANNKTTFQAGVVQKLGENNKIRANFSQGYRSPDIAELYVVSPLYKDGKRYGADVIFPPFKTNSYDLKPEESNSYEIAYENNFNGFISEFVIFRTDIKNKIDLKAYGTGGTKYYTSENLDKVNINGLELNLDYKFTNSFESSFNLTYLDTKDKSTNKELTFTPSISAALNLSYKIIEPLKSNINIRYIGKQYEDAQNKEKIDDYTLVDLGLSYDINKIFTLYGGVDNIFNQKVDTNADINVGTYYFAGVKARF